VKSLWAREAEEFVINTYRLTQKKFATPTLTPTNRENL